MEPTPPSPDAATPAAPPAAATPASGPAPDAPKQPPWDAIAAIIAAMIGLLALLVSGYTAMLQRQQVRAEVWPYLQPGISQTRRTVNLENKGVGPAQVRSLRIYVDGALQRDWPSVFDALGLPELRGTPASTVNGVVFASGETIQQLGFPDDATFHRFFREYPRMQLVLCYCSTLDECWLLDERGRTLERQIESRERIDACPIPGDDEFIDNALPLAISQPAP